MENNNGDPAHNPWWLNMIPAKIKRPTYSYASGGGNRDICWVDGQNNFRKKMIKIIPAIILEAERRVLARPMGVSEWNQHGKKFGYWEYFEKLHLEAITLDEYKKRRALNRALDGKVVIDLETAKLANEAMGWITERDPNEEEAMKFEKAQKELIQAIRAASKPCQETPVMMRKLKPDETTMYKGKKYEVGAQGEWDNGHDFQIMVPVKKSKVTSSPPKPRT